MKGWVPYLCNDVTILCMDLSYGTNIPDHAQHFIDLRNRGTSSDVHNCPEPASFWSKEIPSVGEKWHPGCSGRPGLAIGSRGLLLATLRLRGSPTKRTGVTPRTAPSVTKALSTTTRPHSILIRGHGLMPESGRARPHPGLTSLNSKPASHIPLSYE